MGIERITSAISQGVQDISYKIKHKAVIKKIAIQTSSQRLQDELGVMAEYAKQGIVNKTTKITNIPENMKISSKKAHRLNALIHETQALGDSKKIAKKGAIELIQATGEFSHKNAQKSASVFEKIGETDIEKQIQQAERKANLIEKFKPTQQW